MACWISPVPQFELERRVRAMNPWPGAWFEWNGNVLKVLRASVSEEKGLVSGSRFTVEGRPAIMSADGALVLDEVQPAGKKAMPGKSFLSGAREIGNPRSVLRLDGLYLKISFDWRKNV
jgi:methionyl-tRNA formyltransferase